MKKKMTTTFAKQKLFTQEEVNAMVSKRLKREKKQIEVGYRARRNGLDGIILSAHAINLNTDASIFNRVIGRVNHWQRSGSVDAAFCRTNSTVTLSNMVANSGGRTLSLTRGSHLVGATVFQSGRTTGLTSGTITATGVRETTLSPTLTDLVRASFRSDRGDRGGIVYRVVNNQGLPLGTLTRGVPGGNLSYYCTMTNINLALGLGMF